MGGSICEQLSEFYADYFGTHLLASTRGMLHYTFASVQADLQTAGFAVNYTVSNPIVVFAINFIAVFPSTMLLSFASEELILRTGETIGALINSTFGSVTGLNPDMGFKS